MTEMTERQAKAWPDAVAALNHCAETDIDPTSRWWTFDWKEESRPGRGHDLSALYSDGEYFAQITLDVYGHGYQSIAALTWIHNSGDEECACDVCTKEREDDDQ